MSFFQLKFLGSGGSMGVPVIGCTCAICQSSDPHNKRLRPSLLLRAGQRHFLIDSGPDFRQQALRAHIDKLDGLILTHAHHDHTAGLDELRIFTLRSGQSLPCLMSAATLKELKMRFFYIFNNANPYGLQQTAHLQVQLFPEEQGVVDFEGLKIEYLTYMQGDMPVNGLRFGNMAYITDIKNFPPTIFEALKGIDILILSALRYTPSPLHLSIDEAVDFAKQVNAKQTWLTHIAHELDHEKANAYLPDNIRLSYDGLELSFDGICSSL